jgi:hypothetical protein
LRRSTGEAPGDLASTGGLGDAPIDRDVLQDQTHDAVVGIQRDLCERNENSCSDPLVTTGTDRARRARRVRDALVGTPEPQHLQKFVENDPIADPAAMTPQRMRRIELGPLWQQRGELVPQRLGKP